MIQQPVRTLREDAVVTMTGQNRLMIIDFLNNQIDSTWADFLVKC